MKLENIETGDVKPEILNVKNMDSFSNYNDQIGQNWSN